MKTEQFHRLIIENGWTQVRQKGSHVIYKKGNRTYPVPYHGGAEFGKKLENKIRKEMGLK